MIAALAWALPAFAGSISGVVTDETGGPISGALAIAYDPRLQFHYAVTDAAGAFTIADVPATRVRLRILPSMYDNHQETWWPAGLRVCGGDVLDVPGDVVGIDVTTPEGGELLGQVKATDGSGVPAALLVARTTAQGTTEQARTATTDVNGRFVLRGLPEDAVDHGEFRVEVQVDGWPRQFFGGAYQTTDGLTFTVSPGEHTQIGDQTLLDGIAVGGAVTGPDGPVSTGTAHVYSPSEVVETPIVDGRYLAVGLPPGAVQAWAQIPGVAQTYAPDRDRPGPGVPVLDEGADYESLDIHAPAEAVFSGTLSGGSTMGGIGVLVYNDDRSVALGGRTADDGSFAVGELHPGRYQLFVYGATNDFLDDYLREDSGDVALFDVPSDQVYEIPLVPAGVIEGTVTETPGGAPVYGATIAVETSDGAQRYSIDTDFDGRYRLSGLPAGVYRVRAEYNAYCETDISWTTTWYPGTTNAFLAGGVTINPGDHVTWDAVMGRDADRDGMDDAWEAANGLDPSVADGDLDADGDGYTNLQEYLLGTDPTSPPPEPKPGCGCGGGFAPSALGIAVAGAMMRRRRRA